MNVIFLGKKKKKDLKDVVKNLEMGELSCIGQVGPKCNHMCSYEREADIRDEEMKTLPQGKRLE